MVKPKIKQEERSAFFQDFKVAPLSGGFMLISIFGFLFAALFLSKYSSTWAFAIGFISAIMFFASMISMTKAPVPEELMIDEHITERKERITIMSKKQYEKHIKDLEAKKKKTSKTKSKTKKKVVKKTTKKKVGKKK